MLNEDLNGDIMVLISKPRMLDPLKSGAASTDSLDSGFADSLGSAPRQKNKEESKKQKHQLVGRNSFNYPPDLQTMQKMIEQGSQLSVK